MFSFFIRFIFLFIFRKNVTYGNTVLVRYLYKNQNSILLLIPLQYSFNLKIVLEIKYLDSWNSDCNWVDFDMKACDHTNSLSRFFSIMDSQLF